MIINMQTLFVSGPKLIVIKSYRLVTFCLSISNLLLHMSTDYIFLARKVKYTKAEPLDSVHFYGKSKYIEDLHKYKISVILKVCLIGHEIC